MKNIQKLLGLCLGFLLIANTYAKGGCADFIDNYPLPQAQQTVLTLAQASKNESVNRLLTFCIACGSSCQKDMCQMFPNNWNSKDMLKRSVAASSCKFPSDDSFWGQIILLCLFYGSNC